MTAPLYGLLLRDMTTKILASTRKTELGCRHLFLNGLLRQLVVDKSVLGPGAQELWTWRVQFLKPLSQSVLRHNSAPDNVPFPHVSVPLFD